MKPMLTVRLRMPMLSALIVLILVSGAKSGQVQEADSEISLLVQGLIHKNQAVRTTAFRELRQVREPAVPLLTEVVRRGGIRHATAAAVVLSDLGDAAEAAAPTLLALLHNERTEPWRWYLAAHTLGAAAPNAARNAQAVFIQALDQPEPMKQYGAVRALHKIGSDAEPAIPALRRLLNARRQPFVGVIVDDRAIEGAAVAYTSTASARQYDGLLILETLQRVGAGDDVLLPPLIDLTTHEHYSVRLQAAQQLSRLGARGKSIAAATLVRLLDDEHLEVPQEAIRSLGQLGPHAKSAVPALAELLTGNDGQLRKEAAIALGEIGPAAAAAVPAIERAIQFELVLGGRNVDVMNEALQKITAAQNSP